MLRLFRWLIFGDSHPHFWKIIKETNCKDGEGSTWTRYYLQCDLCGTIKVVDGKK